MPFFLAGSGAPQHDHQDAMFYEQGMADLENVRRSMSTWQMRGAEASSPHAPDRQWHREVQAASSRALSEIADELEEERLPDVDPNGDPLIFPRLDARRARIEKELSVYMPFFRGRADLLEVLRRDLPGEVQRNPAVIAWARRYAESIDGALRAFQQDQFAFDATPSVEISIGAAAYHARQGDPSVLPVAKRQHLARYMPIHLANLNLYRVHESSARELTELLPEARREMWRLAAAVELLTPHAETSAIDRIAQRINAFSAIPPEVKQSVRDLLDARAPVRASLVHRLARTQAAMMTEPEIRAWWTMYFDGAVAALNETGNPPRLQPEWTDALAALNAHDVETREQVQRLLTPAQWEAVSR